ncbi:MAG: TRAP transporter fused permease subunit [Burkholderiaceae bacterium]|nr:TRAP transporter fused permease subunit [Burkholderiaceae bacterium]
MNVPGQARQTSAFGYLAARPAWSATTAMAVAVSTSAAMLWFYAMYSTLFGQAETFSHASTFYLISLFLVFLLRPTRRASWNAPLNAWFIVDLLWALASVAVFLYIKWDVDALTMRGSGAFASDLDRTVAAVFILLTLEATRRTVGGSLALLAAGFFLYSVYSDWFPPPLKAAPMPLERMIDTMFFDTSGIFGLPVAIASTYIVIFLVFGALLFNTGIGRLFTELAFIFTGKARGGPAKASVLGSTMFGMVTGSASANVAVVGTITIPLMKQAGYRPQVAAAVEATASVGSLIAPPVMGAGAFVMAAFMGVSYWDVATMAIIPATLYFWYVFLCVHFEAVRNDIRPWTGALPRLRDSLRERGHLLLPIVLLVILLARGMSAAQAAMWGALATIAVSYLRRSSALTPWRILDAMEKAIVNGLTIFTACGAAGIIIGAVSATGLGTRFTELLVLLSGDQLWIGAILAAFIGLVLGLGLTPTVVYLTMYALVIPALVHLGASEAGAHMMAFYYGMLGELTPPVAISAFTAAAIAGANPMTTSWHTMRFGLLAYILPLVFVYSPELLLIGDTAAIATMVVRVFCGMLLIAAASSGALLQSLGWPARASLVIAGACLLLPSSWWSTALAVVLSIPVMHGQLLAERQGTSLRSARES